MIQKSKRLEFGKPKKKATYGGTKKKMKNAGMRSVEAGMDNNPKETKADFLPADVQRDIAKKKGKKAGYGMSPGKIMAKAGKSPMKAKNAKSPMKDRRKKK